LRLRHELIETKTDSHDRHPAEIQTADSPSSIQAVGRAIKGCRVRIERQAARCASGLSSAGARAGSATPEE